MTCGLEKVDRQGLFVPEGTHRTLSRGSANLFIAIMVRV